MPTCTLPAELSRDERNPPFIKHLRAVTGEVFPFMAENAKAYNRKQKKAGIAGRVQKSGIGGYMRRCNKAKPSEVSKHAHARAADIFLKATDAKEKLFGDELSKMFVDKSDELGVEKVIWNKQSWSAPDWTATTAKKHTDHIHIDFTSEGTQLKATNLKKYCIEVRTEVNSQLRATNEAIGTTK